jgi:hypothetical protein
MYAMDEKLAKLLAETSKIKEFPKEYVKKLEAQIPKMNKEQLDRTYSILSKLLAGYLEIQANKKLRKEQILKKELVALDKAEKAFKKFYVEYKSIKESDDKDQADDLLKNI